MEKKNALYKNEIRLNSPRAVQKLLARTVNKLISDEVDESKARAIGYLGQILLKCFEVSELEERLSKLEQRIGTRE